MMMGLGKIMAGFTGRPSFRVSPLGPIQREALGQIQREIQVHYGTLYYCSRFNLVSLSMSHGSSHLQDGFAIEDGLVDVKLV